MRTIILAVAAALGLTVAAPAQADIAPPPGLIVNDHAVVQWVSTTMPHCSIEDGSSGPVPCTWNIGQQADGNGYGLSFWIGRRHHVHYVWAIRRTDGTLVSPVRALQDPATPYRDAEWVTRSMADQFGLHRPWRHAYVVYANSAVVEWPNGDSRVVS